jgi:hypothetical protein
MAIRLGAGCQRGSVNKAKEVRRSVSTESPEAAGKSLRTFVDPTLPPDECGKRLRRRAFPASDPIGSAGTSYAAPTTTSRMLNCGICRMAALQGKSFAPLITLRPCAIHFDFGRFAKIRFSRVEL